MWPVSIYLWLAKIAALATFLLLLLDSCRLEHSDKVLMHRVRPAQNHIQYV